MHGIPVVGADLAIPGYGWVIVVILCLVFGYTMVHGGGGSED